MTWVGILLTVLGIAGFFTVADDWRHTGELVAVGSVLAAGLLFLAVSFVRRRTR